MPTVNWTTNGATLADQCGWSGDGAAHPFVGQFYVDETYNTDSKASAVRLTGAGFSGTINSAILTLGRFNDNTGANGTLRIRCIAENDPGSLAASGGVAPSARTYRTAYLDYNFPSDAIAVNIDITALIQDLLTAGFTYTGTQKIAIVIAGSSVGGTGWGSNPTVSWRALWLLSSPPTLAITYTESTTVTGTATAALSSLAASSSGTATVTGTNSAALSRLATASVGTVSITGPASASLTSLSTALAGALSITGSLSSALSPLATSGSGTNGASVTIPSLAAHVGVAELYSSPESADGYIVTASGITTTAGSKIYVLACTWQYNDTPSTNRDRDRSVPYDNKGGSYSLIGSVSTPTNWPTAGEAWYVDTTGGRGSGHLFEKNYGYNSEITVIAMEVANAGEISNFSIQQIPTSGDANQTYTASVTCDGPALLVVSMYVDWWEYTAGATPAGWTLVERKGILSPAKDADIHAVVFVRQVTGAGTYTCPMVVAGYQAQAACIQTFAIEAASETITGTASVALSSLTESSSGSVTVTGTLGAALRSLATSESGTITHTGASSVALPQFAASASGAETVTGAVSVALSPLATSSSGAETITGAATATLSPLAFLSSGSQSAGITGGFSAALSGLATGESGTVSITGSKSTALSPLATSGSGQASYTGALAAAISPFSVIASGEQSNGISGALLAALPSLSSGASGSISVSGAFASVLSSLTVTSSGSALMGVSGDLSASLSALSFGSPGTVTNSGALAVAFSTLTAAESGAVSISGPMSSAVSSLSSVSSGDVTQLAISGSLDVSLALRISSNGFVGLIAVGGGSSRTIKHQSSSRRLT